ncbi:MAG: hypothetical protein IT289_00775 [Oligoflexia bacterium]|nr:hypothetical protein [Oligoflexia bacterium]
MLFFKVMRKLFLFLLVATTALEAHAQSCNELITAPGTAQSIIELMKLRCEYNNRIAEAQGALDDAIDEAAKIDTEKDHTVDEQLRRSNDRIAENRNRLQELIIKRDLLSGLISHLGRRSQPESEFALAMKDYIRTLTTPESDDEVAWPYATRLLAASKAREPSEKISVFVEEFLDANSVESPQTLRDFLKKRQYLGSPKAKALDVPKPSIAK